MTINNFTSDMIVDIMLRGVDFPEDPTPEFIQHKVDELLVGPFAHLASERKQIVDDVLGRVRVRVGSATTLDDKNDNHTPWLPDHDRVSWRFWPRLERFLFQNEKLPPSVVQELDRSTDQTLALLEDPARTDPWDRRGLVVGHVQSGKTTHYTALAAKALDAGYQIVLVLAGIHNSLRSQTHERIDKHLIGRNSEALMEALRTKNPADVATLKGVGADDHERGEPQLPVTVITCTNSSPSGDFRTKIAEQIALNVSSGSRLVMVVKKNPTILNRLIPWLNMLKIAGHSKISAPTLVIDDEADHASVNTKRDPDADPTTINQLIRTLLKSFEHVGFVGYTATPFANIFISSDDDHPKFGADLFPRSFIVNLQAPNDYVGPGLVFGHPGDESIGIAAQPSLPMFREVNDAAAWLPDRHNKTAIPGQLPASLREAVRAFMLVCAARSARGDEDKHNSMLVHATRFINVQGLVTEQLANELTALKNLICSGSLGNLQAMRKDLSDLWQRRFVEDYHKFNERLGDRCPEPVAWNDVWKHLPNAVKRIELMRINGDSTDTLAYEKNKQGLYVIAVGADKLSRGLTLEGLSISYFLRTTNMFDTLLQMGRWFGYRKGYVDLCRVYTTTTLYNAFREVALALDDLREDLNRMAFAEKTPMEFGLRVRTPSDGLLITAANKIRRGEQVEVRFAGTLVQTLEVMRTGARADQLREATRQLIANNGPWDRTIRDAQSPHYIWRGQNNADAVLDFLERYEAISTPSFNNHCDALRRYIREQLTYGELTDWTVAVISKGARPDGVTVRISDTLSIPAVDRSRRQDHPESWDRDRFTTQVLSGSLDEAIDLSAAEFLRARELSTKDPKRPGETRTNPEREAIRKARPARRGLLFVYLVRDQSVESPVEFIPCIAISFPESGTAKPLTYTVNEVWRQKYGLLEEDEFDVYDT